MICIICLARDKAVILEIFICFLGFFFLSSKQQDGTLLRVTEELCNFMQSTVACPEKLGAGWAPLHLGFSTYTCHLHSKLIISCCHTLSTTID